MVSQEIVYQLLEQGFSVIPSGGGESGKAPIIKWEPYQKRLPDKKELEHWNYKDKPALWGIVTGSVSGVVVVDADDGEARARIESASIKPHVETPRGGAHYYFQHPGYPVKTVAGLLPKIDVRGDGGFVNIMGKRRDGEYRIITLPARGNLLPWDKFPSFIKDQLASTDSQALPDTETIITEGKRNHQLTSLAGTMRRRGMSQSSIESALLKENQERCSPPLSESEVSAIAKSVSRYAPSPTKPPKERQPVSNITFTPQDKVVNTVQPVEVNWLWYPYIPLGKLTLLEGDPGVGKSWVSLAIATSVSLGTGLPAANGNQPPVGPVLLATAEDGLADTVRPRLDAMQANTGIIVAITGLFTLDDAGFDYLESMIEKHIPALVIIDPLVAYLSSEIDIHRGNAVRYATSRLEYLAEKWNCAIIAIRHLTKGGNMKPIYRGLGSIEFTGQARSVLLAGADPDNPTVRGIVQIKCNLAPVGGAVGYELRDGNFYWTEHSNLTADQILSAADDGGPLEEAKSFLQTALSDGPLAAKELLKDAGDAGISTPTLKRAKKVLNIDTYREGEEGKRGGGTWYWKLPGVGD